MKNIIFFNNYNDKLIYSKSFNHNLDKLINSYKNNKNKSNELQKLNIYNENIDKIKTKLGINQDYITISNTNYLKILTLAIVNICNIYININKHKPHFITSIFESNIILNICKQLYKNNIIELSIIDNENILEELKKYKKSNTLICLLSNINNNIFYNLKKIYSYCKYYNILLFSNIEEELLNYYNLNLSNSYFNNQDIFIYNSNAYIVKEKICNYYHIFIKKNLINKFKLEEIIHKFILNSNTLSDNILLNTIDINKYYNIKELNLKKVESLYEYLFNILNSKYKILYYNELVKINDIKYFYNIPTIILFNNISNSIPLINNIYFSLFIPNLKFTNTNIIDYFKNNNVILNQIHKNYIQYTKYANDIKKGLINLIISPHTKISEINKFIIIFNNLIDNLFSLEKNNIKPNKKKKKKTVQFTSPEFIILHKKFIHSSKFKKLKSILKKNK